MVFYRILPSMIRGAISIKANVPYRSNDVYKDPTLLKENNTFKFLKGKNKYEVLTYDDVRNFAISQKIMDAFTENNITGWESYPIVIEGTDEKYYGFHVTGKGGKITNLESNGAVSSSEPIEWEEDKWDGSDIFSLEDRSITVITPRVKEILDNFNVKNLFIDLL